MPKVIGKANSNTLKMPTNSNKIIGLITDFGDKGFHYVAAMKAIILRINSKVPIIDITHYISSYSVLEAAYILKTTYILFPQNSIFIIVVDPGVGSSREILAVKTNSNYYFIGPNNGIFSLLFKFSEIDKCIHIQNEEFFNKPVSSTFHGRDIMAPVGAYISKNILAGYLISNFQNPSVVCLLTKISTASIMRLSFLIFFAWK